MHPRFKLTITSPVALTKLTAGELKAELAHNRRASAVPKLKNAWSVHGKARSPDEALLPTRLGSEERTSDAAAEVPLLESHETTRFRTLLQTMLEKHMTSGSGAELESALRLLVGKQLVRSEAEGPDEGGVVDTLSKNTTEMNKQTTSKSVAQM